MVYYFSSSVVEPAGFIYVGKDKFESEFLSPGPCSMSLFTVNE